MDGRDRNHEPSYGFVLHQQAMSGVQRAKCGACAVVAEASARISGIVGSSQGRARNPSVAEAEQGLPLAILGDVTSLGALANLCIRM